MRVGGGPPTDGGRRASGWAIVGKARCAGCSEIWRAATPKGVDSRQFYVNGIRANRTWVALPAGITKQLTALTVPGTAMLGWTKNASAIELVYRGGGAGSQWQESRCPVAAISNGSLAKLAGTARVWSSPLQLCAADYCDHERCPAADPRDHELLNKSGPHGVDICPAATPFCVNYVFDAHMGTCATKGPGAGNLTGTTVVEVAVPCVINGNNKIKGTHSHGP
jgi:hypothetical protein